MYKVLWYGDTPTCATGFAQVTRNVLKELHKTGKFDIDILGVNFGGDPYDRDKFPYRIYPASTSLNPRYDDLMGRVKLLDMLERGNFDLVFLLQDTFNMLPIMDKLLAIQEKKKFILIYYFVIDVITPRREWITKVISKIDYPISCTQYAKDVCMEFDPDLKRINVIEYGVDTNVFRPIDEKLIQQFRDSAFKSSDPSDKKSLSFLVNKFIVLNVNRNQIRKDYVSTFLAFKKFKEVKPDSILFCLCSLTDQGGDLRDIANYFKMEYGKDWFCPANYTPGDGFPLEVVNLIYNLSNMVISTSSGEGFGLSSIEAMATKKPVVFPDNTSFKEIIGKDRGYLVPCDGHLFFSHQDNNMIRPKINVDKMVETMLYCDIHTTETETKVEAAYKWALSQTWESKLEKWMEVIDRAIFRLNQMRK